MTLQRLKLIIVDDEGTKTVELGSYTELKKYALSESEPASTPVTQVEKEESESASKKKLIKNKLQEKIQENKMEDAEETPDEDESDDEENGDRKKSFWDKLK